MDRSYDRPRTAVVERLDALDVPDARAAAIPIHFSFSAGVSRSMAYRSIVRGITAACRFKNRSSASALARFPTSRNIHPTAL